MDPEGAPKGRIRFSDAELADELIARMNAILDGMNEQERGSIARLLNVRVPCVRSLVDHPTIQAKSGVICKLGCLGFLNGVVGVDMAMRGLIAAEFERDTGRLVRFSRSRRPPGTTSP